MTIKTNSIDTWNLYRRSWWKSFKYKLEKATPFINFLMFIFTFLTVVFSYLAIQDAKETTELAKQNINTTSKIAQWYYEPQPQMDLWTSEDYELNKSGVILIDEWYDYINGSGFNIRESIYASSYSRFGNNSGYYEAPGYLACCKEIKIFVYNSGRGSIIYPLLSLDLESKNETDGILFKVHTVRTAVDKLEYDPIKKYIRHSRGLTHLGQEFSHMYKFMIFSSNLIFILSEFLRYYHDCVTS